jgi:uncharacterized protein YjbI with pentapeptide repeats
MVEEKGKQAEEQQDEPRLWRPWRPPRRRMGWRVLWAVGMVVALLTTVLTTGLLIVHLRRLGIWKDLLEGGGLTLVALGFSLTAIVVMLAIAGARRSWTGFQGKTVWDFLQLLIVPLMLVAIGLVFALQQDARQNSLEENRARAERELADQRAQDEALQAYLNQMSQLMLERTLLEAEQGAHVHTLAQARTSTVILRLDAEHNESVTRFLSNSGLAARSEDSARLLREITLSHATLSGAYLPKADLSSADLSSADLEDAHLIGADLSYADLSYADLSRVHLIGANLSDANLRGADLSNIDLSGADLSSANLEGAYLSYADLSDANLRGANLKGVGTDILGANLEGADLSGALKLSAEKIVDAVAHHHLEGATMPNGQKYEDWLKSKENGKNE